jgi:hypothetical protein
VVIGLAFAGLFGGTFTAYAACSNPSPLPSGYAAPCPVFSVSPALVAQSGTETLSASPQPGTDYIYTTAYYAQGSTWLPVTLTGNNAAPSYSSGPAQGSLTPSILSTLTPVTNYVVLWDWLWDATSQCYKGPGLNQCNTGTWRVQSFTITSTYTYSQSAYYTYSQAAYATPSTTPGIPSALFGLHINNFPQTAFPTMPFGAFRFWDSGARWPEINTANGVYDWSKLDALLLALKTHGISEIGFTLGGVPVWASTNPNDATCDYAVRGDTGSCDLPSDINADGTGTDATYIAWLTAIARHNQGLDPTVYAHIHWWEPWNEWHRNPIVSPNSIFSSYSFKGTYAQMVRLAEDARCTISGRGSVNGVPCGKTAIDPTALILTPSTIGHLVSGQQAMQNFLYCNSNPAPNSRCTTGTRGSASADVINSHFYVTGGIAAESVAADVAVYKTFLSSTDRAKPLWSDEGSWGQNSIVPDTDLQAAFVARYYFSGLSAGLSEMYWDSYDIPTFGSLFSNGALTKAGIAYQVTYAWMVGASLSAPCSASGTVWTCGLTRSGGYQALAMWDTAQTCSASTCNTSNKTVGTQYLHYKDLAGVTYAIPSTHLVPVGIKPILLENR